MNNDVTFQMVNIVKCPRWKSKDALSHGSGQWVPASADSQQMEASRDRMAKCAILSSIFQMVVSIRHLALAEQAVHDTLLQPRASPTQP